MQPDEGGGGHVVGEFKTGEVEHNHFRAVGQAFLHRRAQTVQIVVGQDANRADQPSRTAWDGFDGDDGGRVIVHINLGL